MVYENGTLMVSHARGCVGISMSEDAASAGRRLGNDAFKWGNDKSGGINNYLHGHWNFEYISTSDRSLKENVTPLMQSLQARTRLGGYGDLSWESLLEELRPVSYNYKGTSEMRFGFIAQEMESAIPDVVFTRPGVRQKPDRKGIMYMDLVAVLISLARGMFDVDLWAPTL